MSLSVNPPRPLVHNTVRFCICRLAWPSVSVPKPSPAENQTNDDQNLIALNVARENEVETVLKLLQRLWLLLSPLDNHQLQLSILFLHQISDSFLFTQRFMITEAHDMQHHTFAAKSLS